MRSERHTERARGQGVAAFLVAALVVGGGVALQAGLGPARLASGADGTAPSGAWFCPHGGGPKEWKASIFLANPGSEPVTARLTPISAGGSGAGRQVVVPPDSEVRETVPAKGREASTFVESFGGWLAAGWVTQGGGGEIGVGAEPCSAIVARTWYAVDGTTTQGEDAYLVVMNPFASDAILSVVLLTKARAPIRDAGLTDVVLQAHRSMAIHLNEFALGEQAVGAQVDVSVGRVAVSSLGIAKAGGIRSVLGASTASSTWYLPAGAGAGQSSLVVMAPTAQPLRFDATLLSRDLARPTAGLTGASQNPMSTAVYPVSTAGPSAIQVQTQSSVGVVAAQRAEGVGHDTGATGGAPDPANDWVVLPSVAGDPARPGLVLVNPGRVDATVTLHLLVPVGAQTPADVVVTVPAASAASAPSAFLEMAADGAVVVHSSGAPVIAMGASTSLGVKGVSTYALSMGVVEPSPG